MIRHPLHSRVGVFRHDVGMSCNPLQHKCIDRESLAVLKFQPESAPCAAIPEWRVSNSPPRIVNFAVVGFRRKSESALSLVSR